MKDAAALRLLRRRWLDEDPAAYDREAARIAVQLAALDAPLLAACRGHVLELACGTGRLLRRIAALPAVSHAVGLDLTYLEALWRRFLGRGRLPRSWRTLDGADGVGLDLRGTASERDALAQAGLRLLELRGVRFLPFLRRWRPPGYWRGRVGVALGSDLIFLAQRPLSPPGRTAVAAALPP